MLILYNANVITMDPTLPRAELVAVEGDRIVSVGDNGMLKSLKSVSARTIDCGGRTLLPGFIDAHCHIQAFAEGLVSLDLSPREGVNSISDVQYKIRNLCINRPRGAWIRGKGYNEFYLEEKRHPNRWDLDAAAPFHPVKLTHRSGHAHVLNSPALARVGITEETGDPPGGMIDRDTESGKPTGILYGMGRYLTRKAPAVDDADLERGLALANETLVSYGITSIQDATPHNDPQQWRRFAAWKKKGILHPRLSMAIGFEGFSKKGGRPYVPDILESDLKLGGVKIVTDRITGNLHPDQESLNEMVAAIHEAGLQALIHAVEEPVVEAACNAIEFALKRHPRREHRHRIEHCSVCSFPILRRIGKLGIAVVTQPSFIYYSGDRYMKTVPRDQLKDLYPVGSMLTNDLLVGAGSDIPIAGANPMIGIFAAVTRSSESGGHALPGPGTSISDAIKMYTSWAAYAGFDEDIKGSVSAGKLADLVILNEDPSTVDSVHIKDIRVNMTLIGGHVVWNDDSLQI